jgi:hypothetical protein
MDFEAYLLSKKIDSAAFLKAERDIWQNWKDEFEQVHPNSFTAQKLYLINPIRRKYPLTQEQAKPEVKPAIAMQATVNETAASPETPIITTNPVNPKPAIPRPIIKPKPKIN